MPFFLNRKNNLAYRRRKGSSKSKFKDSSSIFRRDSEKSKKRASTNFKALIKFQRYDKLPESFRNYQVNSRYDLERRNWLSR